MEYELGSAMPNKQSIDWIRRVYRENGELPSSRLALMALHRKLDLTCQAFEELADVARRDTGHGIPLHPDASEPSPDFPGGMVTVAESGIQSFDRNGVYAEVADAIQTYLADRYRVLWPLCPLHGTGLHAVVHEGHAVWWCNTGDHEGRALRTL
ncbi:hypothetical protein [Streptomyces sp. NPDC000229]|uniref:hypothetical protein n=1 Tax=Streptomyces sp. NPDC000229 TaxID=3154247 RepID=UPI00331CE330